MESIEIANNTLAEFDAEIDKMPDWRTRLKDAAHEVEDKLLTHDRLHKLVQEFLLPLAEALRLHNLSSVRALIFEVGQQLAILGVPASRLSPSGGEAHLATLYNRLRDLGLSSFALDHMRLLLLPNEDISTVDADGGCTSIGRRITWDEVKAARPLSWSNTGSWLQQFERVGSRNRTNQT